MIYRASSGNEYDLTLKRHYLKTASFHDWEWSPKAKEKAIGVNVSQFGRDAKTYEATLALPGARAEREKQLDALHEDMERDVQMKTPGKLICSGYTIDCYPIASKTYSNDSGTRTLNDIKFYCPYPLWSQETLKSFGAVSEGGETSGGFDYEFDYEFDYMTETGLSLYWDIEHFCPVEFRMTIYGPCTNPAITIGGHVYQVYQTLASSEYMVIDSRERTVTKYLVNGTPVNVFNSRRFDISVFDPLPVGKVQVIRSSGFGVDILIFKERSEPAWT